MVICKSCGREMNGKLRANKNEREYCVECTWEDGSLRSKEEVRENLINYYMRETGNPREVVEEVVDEILNRMPAWKM